MRIVENCVGVNSVVFIEQIISCNYICEWSLNRELDFVPTTFLTNFYLLLF